jgi:hypothetical protein
MRGPSWLSHRTQAGRTFWLEAVYERLRILGLIPVDAQIRLRRLNTYVIKIPTLNAHVEISTYPSKYSLKDAHDLNLPKRDISATTTYAAGTAMAMSTSGVDDATTCELGETFGRLITAKSGDMIYVLYAYIPATKRAAEESELNEIAASFRTSSITPGRYAEIMKAHSLGSDPEDKKEVEQLTQQGHAAWNAGDRGSAARFYCEIADVDQSNSLARFGVGVIDSQRRGAEEESVKLLRSFLGVFGEKPDPDNQGYLQRREVAKETIQLVESRLQNGHAEDIH